MEETGIGMKRSSSRFQVNRVDSQRKQRANSFEDAAETEIGTPQRTADDCPSDEPRRLSIMSILSCDSSHKGWSNTHDALPREDHYRNILSATPGVMSRPTLAELHEEMEDGELRNKDSPLAASKLASTEKVDQKGGLEPEPEAPVKFGWIQGVFIRCLLNIWGVMLFIRISWCVAHAGILATCGIILLSSLVTMITTISMSAICTNGVVKGGGAYFLISRSLGPEFGGAIGIIFAVANAVAVAMYVVGFAETAVELMNRQGAEMVDFKNDIRIIGVSAVFILLGITLIGMAWETRAQIFLLVVLVTALVNFFAGTFLPVTKYKLSRGYTGYDITTFRDNFLPAYRNSESFATVFSIFFPAATGILAGANISGDLKDPPKAIPKGTALAIVITTIVYLLVAILLGSTLMREANGFQPAIIANLVASNETLSSLMTGSSLVYSTTTEGGSSSVSTTTFHMPDINASQYIYSRENIANCSLMKEGCKFGLYNDFQAMSMIAGYAYLTTAGIFSATLSSALASMVSAPKIFQAVCKDGLFPRFRFFAKVSARNMPYRAFVLTFIVGAGCTLIADLNSIAPLISMFFLATYALINFSCFDISLANPPGWRPAFKLYNKWLSLLGFLICLAVMFLIEWIMALVCVVIVGAAFMYVKYIKPDVNWGSSSQAHVYRNVLKFSLRLLHIGDHVKTFRPQVLVLTGEPENRPALIDFASHITKRVGLMVCGNVITGLLAENLRQINVDSAYKFFETRRAKSFYTCSVAPSFRLGVQSMLQNVGIGKFKPNLLLMGFKGNWTFDNPENVQEYFNIIHDAFDLHYGIGIFRMKEGLCMGLNEGDATIFSDPSDPTDDELSLSDKEDEDANKTASNGQHINHNGHSAIPTIVVTPTQPVEKVKLEAISNETITQFNIKKVPEGTIDVWWLFDDGGLTLLIPHLLKQKVWKKCSIRIFVLGTKKGEIDRVQRELVGMLQKFRLSAKEVEVVPQITKECKKESVKMFQDCFKPWLLDEEHGETQEQFPWKSSRAEVDLLSNKTKRHIRLRELLIEKSSGASLIVMTLPMPRKGTCSAGLYMSWIDILTRDMPPFLLLRGNQQSVLTYYT